MWSLKTETVLVVIGAPGLVKKGVGQYLKKKNIYIYHSFIQNNNNNNNNNNNIFFYNKNDTKLYS